MILAGMALGRADVLDAAILGVEVVPMREPHRPRKRGVQIGEAVRRELRPVFRGAEQSLGEGIVLSR